MLRINSQIQGPQQKPDIFVNKFIIDRICINKSYEEVLMGCDFIKLITALQLNIWKGKLCNEITY